jgi:hypothetical protein
MLNAQYHLKIARGKYHTLWNKSLQPFFLRIV